MRYAGLEPLVSQAEMAEVIATTLAANFTDLAEDDDCWICVQVTPGQGFPHPMMKGRRGAPNASGLGLSERPGADPVEARAAVDRAVVPGGERDHRLGAAGAADRGMELADPLGAGALRRGATRRTAGGIVHEPLRGEEGLLACREGEGVSAVATVESAVFVHRSKLLYTGECETLFLCAVGE